MSRDSSTTCWYSTYNAIILPFTMVKNEEWDIAQYSFYSTHDLRCRCWEYVSWTWKCHLFLSNVKFYWYNMVQSHAHCVGSGDSVMMYNMCKNCMWLIDATLCCSDNSYLSPSTHHDSLSQWDVQQWHALQQWWWFKNIGRGIAIVTHTLG